MQNKLRVIIAICFFTLSTIAQNTEWTVTSSAITFKIKNAGFTVDGDFKGLEAKINFDASKSFSNAIEATIDAKNINTGNNSRDNHLRKEEYFSVEKFPKIKLSGSTFTKQADGSFKGYFKLTLKGITKDMVIPFTFIEKENKATIEGELKLNRRDYGVGGSSIMMSDNVSLTIKTELEKK
jgi:polyisoprenoid-binding protein YceI